MYVTIYNTLLIHSKKQATKVLISIILLILLTLFNINTFSAFTVLKTLNKVILFQRSKKIRFF